MAKRSSRPQRSCDVCEQTDDHPRHVIGTPERGGTVRHMDCCAAEGCDICATSEAENEGRRGQELIDHLNETRN